MNNIFLIRGGSKLLCMFLLSALLFGCASTRESNMVGPYPSVVRDAKSLEEEWGIKVIGARLTAEGHMIDFRYRVMDVEKAKPLFDRKAKPYLIDHKSGARFIVPDTPKIGALRQVPKIPVADKNYFIFFANAGGVLQQGSKVSIVIGDFKAENLVIE